MQIEPTNPDFTARFVAAAVAEWLTRCGQDRAVLVQVLAGVIGVVFLGKTLNSYTLLPTQGYTVVNTDIHTLHKMKTKRD